LVLDLKRDVFECRNRCDFLFLESIDDVKERMDAADEDSLQVELSVDAL
jgi:hypothetical protein